MFTEPPEEPDSQPVLDELARQEQRRLQAQRRPEPARQARQAFLARLIINWVILLAVVLLAYFLLAR